MFDANVSNATNSRGCSRIMVRLRNLNHLHADYLVHRCLRSNDSIPVVESTNVSIHPRFEQHEHAGYAKLTLEIAGRANVVPLTKKTISV